MRAPPAYVTRAHRQVPSIHLSVTSPNCAKQRARPFCRATQLCWTLFSPLLICQYYLSLALLNAECVQHVLRPKGRGQFACLTPFESLRWLRPPVSRDRLDSSPVIPYVIKACICQDITGYRPRQEKLGCGHDELVSRVPPEDLDPGTNKQSGPVRLCSRRG